MLLRILPAPSDLNGFDHIAGYDARVSPGCAIERIETARPRGAGINQIDRSTIADAPRSDPARCFVIYTVWMVCMRVEDNHARAVEDVLLDGMQNEIALA